jgi:hypothetical protein
VTPRSFVPAVHTLPHSLSERTMQGAYVRCAGRGAPFCPEGPHDENTYGVPICQGQCGQRQGGVSLPRRAKPPG